MKCPKCGSEIDSKAEKCSRCGASLKHRKGKMKFWIPAGAGLLCVLIIILVGLMIHPQKTEAERLQEQLDLGNKFLNSTDYKNAEVAFNQALKIDKKSNEAALGLAKVYNETNKPEESAKLLKQVEKNIADESKALKSGIKYESLEFSSSKQEDVTQKLRQQQNQYQEIYRQTQQKLQQAGNTKEAAELERSYKETVKNYEIVINVVIESQKESPKKEVTKRPTVIPTEIPVADSIENDDENNETELAEGISAQLEPNDDTGLDEYVPEEEPQEEEAQTEETSEEEVPEEVPEERSEDDSDESLEEGSIEDDSPEEENLEEETAEEEVSAGETPEEKAHAEEEVNPLVEVSEEEMPTEETAGEEAPEKETPEEEMSTEMTQKEALPIEEAVNMIPESEHTDLKSDEQVQEDESDLKKEVLNVLFNRLSERENFFSSQEIDYDYDQSEASLHGANGILKIEWIDLDNDGIEELLDIQVKDSILTIDVYSAQIDEEVLISPSVSSKSALDHVKESSLFLGRQIAFCYNGKGEKYLGVATIRWEMDEENENPVTEEFVSVFRLREDEMEFVSDDEVPEELRDLEWISDDVNKAILLAEFDGSMLPYSGKMLLEGYEENQVELRKTPSDLLILWNDTNKNDSLEISEDMPKEESEDAQENLIHMETVDLSDESESDDIGQDSTDTVNIALPTLEEQNTDTQSTDEEELNGVDAKEENEEEEFHIFLEEKDNEDSPEDDEESINETHWENQEETENKAPWENQDEMVNETHWENNGEAESEVPWENYEKSIDEVSWENYEETGYETPWESNDYPEYENSWDGYEDSDIEESGYYDSSNENQEYDYESYEAEEGIYYEDIDEGVSFSSYEILSEFASQKQQEEKRAQSTTALREEVSQSQAEEMNGLIGCEILDLNGDGDDEMVLIKIVQGCLAFAVYQENGGTAIQISIDHALESGFISYDSEEEFNGRQVCFVKDIGSEKLIGIAESTSTYYEEEDILDETVIKHVYRISGGDIRELGEEEIPEDLRWMDTDGSWENSVTVLAAIDGYSETYDEWMEISIEDRTSY